MLQKACCMARGPARRQACGVQGAQIIKGPGVVLCARKRRTDAGQGEAYLACIGGMARPKERGARAEAGKGRKGQGRKARQEGEARKGGWSGAGGSSAQALGLGVCVRGTDRAQKQLRDGTKGRVSFSISFRIQRRMLGAAVKRRTSGQQKSKEARGKGPGGSKRTRTGGKDEQRRGSPLK